MWNTTALLCACHQYMEAGQEEEEEEYLVPIMENLDYPALIEEWKQNIDAAAYEKNLYQDLKLPSIKKKIDRNDKIEYWPTSIKESLNWLPFLI